MGKEKQRRQPKAKLRQRAEAALAAGGTSPASPQPGSDPEKLIHELHVHQIELEMQTRELREAQQLLEESRDRYADLYEFAPVGYLTFDKSGIIQDLNLTAANMLGLQRPRLLGMPFRKWVAKEAKRDFLHHVRQVYGSGQAIVTELRMESGTDRPLHVRLESTAADVHGAKTCRTAMIDITERKRAEQERERLIAALEGKNAELERFTYTVSHDLKSPLITIDGFLGRLEKDAAGGDTERLQGDIAQIRAASATMQQLLKELLELSRIGRLTNPPEDVSLGELAREAVDLVAGRIAERGVQVDIAPDLPVVFGDRPRLREVLQNLIDNAVKFMGAQTAPRVEVGARQTGEATLCYVRDNGVGIAPCYHEKVFGLFERLDAESEGTGLGLALVKRIIELHGGRVWVESEGEGRGCIFYFTIPRRRGIDRS